MVWQLADGRVFKLGFDYSESWFIHNLNVLVPDEFDMWDALPRIDYHRDLSHLEGWKNFLRMGSPTFEGPQRDAGLFVCIREDVRSLKEFGHELVIHKALTESARFTRTSMDEAEKLESADPYDAVAVPNLREGIDSLEEFETSGHPGKIFGVKNPTPQQWEAVEQAQLLIHPIISLQRHLYSVWGILLPDARGHNAGITLDSNGDREICVLRDLGFVYAPQYTEWDVAEALPLPTEE
jgi:hypothetical protein